MKQKYRFCMALKKCKCCLLLVFVNPAASSWTISELVSTDLSHFNITMM